MFQALAPLCVRIPNEQIKIAQRMNKKNIPLLITLNLLETIAAVALLAFGLLVVFHVFSLPLNSMWASAITWSTITLGSYTLILKFLFTFSALGSYCLNREMATNRKA